MPESPAVIVQGATELQNVLRLWREYQDGLENRNPAGIVYNSLDVHDALDSAIRDAEDGYTELDILMHDVARENSAELSIIGSVSPMTRYLQSVRTRSKKIVDRLKAAHETTRKLESADVAPPATPDARREASHELQSAIVACIGNTRRLDDAKNVLVSGFTISQKGWWARLLWRIPSTAPLVSVLVGVTGLFALSVQHEESESNTLRRHVQIADQAIVASQRNLAIVSQQLRLALPGIDSSWQSAGSKSAAVSAAQKDTVLKSNLDTVRAAATAAAAVEKAHQLNVAATKSFEQVLTFSIANGTATAVGLAPQVRQAMALEDLIKALQVSASKNKTSAAAPATAVPFLSVPPREFIRLIAAQSEVLCNAVKAGSSSSSSRCATGDDASTTEIGIRTESNPSRAMELARADTGRPVSEPGIAESAFQGRSPLAYLVKLLFAVVYLMIAGGVLVILSNALGLTDANKTVDSVPSGIVETGLKSTASLVTTGLLAPIGLAAGYWLAPNDSLAASERKAAENIAAVTTLSAGDRTRIDSLFSGAKVTADSALRVIKEVRERAQ